MPSIYYDRHADIKVLKSKRLPLLVTVVKDMHMQETCMTVALRLWWDCARKVLSGKEPKKDGLKVITVAEAAKIANIIMILIPDDKQRTMYDNEIAPSSEKRVTLLLLAMGLISILDK